MNGRTVTDLKNLARNGRKHIPKKPGKERTDTHTRIKLAIANKRTDLPYARNGREKHDKEWTDKQTRKTWQRTEGRTDLKNLLRIERTHIPQKPCKERTDAPTSKT